MFPPIPTCRWSYQWPGARAAIDLQYDTFAFNLHARDLDLVADARGRSVVAQRFGPIGFIVAAVALHNQRFFRVRQDDFHGGELGSQAAFNFHAFVKAEFVGTQSAGGKQRR